MIFKCKMCGGALEITDGLTTCECTYCGTSQTLPKLNNEKKTNLYDRADHFRRNNDFDKAMSIYEQILNEDTTDAEAYWSLVLCKYGIEYVDDPVTHRKVPTVNRTQYTSIYADENYKAAIQNADSMQKSIYESEAKVIDDIQKGILEISNKEEPFDVFICYKETDSNGRRTQDSVLANDLYHQLTQEGFKVFFSRITLEDKLGSAYEPYIFAALNSAKVMVVLGTKPEYFNAVWVKNEWSRYLGLIKNGANKMLIPAYRDMDPYDLPEEFSHLQAQDMTKLGFMQDLIRGIKKIISIDQSQSIPKETVSVQQTNGLSNTNALIKRGNMALEDGEWKKADEFFEDVLNQDAECAEAYLGKLLAKCKRSNMPSLVQYYISKYESSETEELEACEEATSRIETSVSQYMVLDYLSDMEIRKQYAFNRTYVSELSFRKQQKSQELFELAGEKLLSRAQQYATGKTKNLIDKMMEDITVLLDRRIADAQRDDNEQIAYVKSSYEMHLNRADEKVKELYKDALERQEYTYNSRVSRMNASKTISDYEKFRDLFKGMHGYRDTNALADKCQTEIDRISEEQRLEKEWLEEVERKRAKEQKRKKGIFILVALIVIAVGIVGVNAVQNEIVRNRNYNAAVELLNSGKYEDAIIAFEALNGYKDSKNQISACDEKICERNYNAAVELLNSGKYEDAIIAFGVLGEYRDSSDQIKACNVLISERKENDYNAALELLDSGKYEDAIIAFEALVGYKDSSDQIKACNALISEREENDYNEAVELLNSGRYEEALSAFKELDDYKDSNELLVKAELNIMRNASEGDVVQFGNYLGNTEWVVLAREHGKIFVISKYALEKRAYNTEYVSITWESCSLRSWLNGEYMANTFNSYERALLLSTSTTVLNRNHEGNDTEDKLFVLSTDEANKYFSSDIDRQATLSDGTPVFWWLRDCSYLTNSNDTSSQTTGGVTRDGWTTEAPVHSAFAAVRPAMWIDISDL